MTETVAPKVAPDERLVKVGPLARLLTRPDIGAFLGAVAARDFPRSSVRTQELLGWRPVHPGLIADLEEGHYFNS